MLLVAVGLLAMGLPPVFTAALGLASATSVALASLLQSWAGRSLLLAPLFTRLNRDQLLRGEGVRPKIMDLLKHEPGLGITDVCQRLEIGWGTAVHHLTRLERAGLLVSHDAGRRRRFFLPGESRSKRTAICVLSTDLNRRLLAVIQRRPGITQTEVCEALGVSPSLAHKYLGRLIDQGLLARERQWRTVQYYVKDEARAAFREFEQLKEPLGAQGSKEPS